MDYQKIYEEFLWKFDFLKWNVEVSTWLAFCFDWLMWIPWVKPLKKPLPKYSKKFSFLFVDLGYLNSAEFQTVASSII